MELINSLKDERIQSAKRLNSVKGRILDGKILLEGEEIIKWASESEAAFDYILTSLQDVKHIVEMLPGVSIFRTTEGLMKKVTETNYLIPIIAVGKIPCERGKDDFVIVLDDVKDFGNIGTIIRTGAAFGINKIHSTKKDFDIYQKKTIEASRGAVFRTSLLRHQNSQEAFAFLRERKYQIVTTSPYGSELQSLVNLTKNPIALVLGNETNGVSDVFNKNSDFLVQIPMVGEIESLNVGVAAGISVYELKLKQVIQMIDEKIKSTLGREMNVASVLISEALDSSLRKVTSLSSSQFIFMMVLKCDEIMSPVNIKKQFGILDSEFEPFMKKMLDDGLVKAVGDDLFSITDKGLDTIGKLWTIVEKTEEMILKGFSVNERAVLFDMLNRIKQNCIETNKL